MENQTPARICDAISDEIIGIAARIAKEEGAHKVSVRRIINEMGVTNRVFYNRFRNCDEVLRIVYGNAVEQMHIAIHPDYQDKAGFVAFCLDTVERVLIETYDVKMQFSRYMFEHDSLTENNRLWWAEGIKKHYAIALQNGWVKDVDTDALCYAIWCFCRGYNADAVTRKLPKEEAVRYFRFGFQCFLDGVLL